MACVTLMRSAQAVLDFVAYYKKRQRGLSWAPTRARSHSRPRVHSRPIALARDLSMRHVVVRREGCYCQDEMSNALQQLVELLGLERLDDTNFRGQSQDLGWGNIFGGQALGQALSAAAQTVPQDRLVHSLHAYFLRLGDASKPVHYAVDCIRDGKSFTTRRVVAEQKGRAIFNLAASFQRVEDGPEHQRPMMPEAPDPESLPTESEIIRRYADRLPPGMRRRGESDRPFEIRNVDPMDPTNPEKRPPVRQVWCRANGPLPDDAALHRYLLAYASDFNMMPTAVQPHGLSWLKREIIVASLDHAMWFHQPFRVDEWLLYDLESPSASGARGLVNGRFFKRDGTLVATTLQEGLMRPRKP